MERKICGQCGKQFRHIGFDEKFLQPAGYSLFILFGIFVFFVAGNWYHYAFALLMVFGGVFLVWAHEDSWKRYAPTTTLNRCPSCGGNGIDEDSPGGIQLIEKWKPPEEEKEGNT